MFSEAPWFNFYRRGKRGGTRGFLSWLSSPRPTVDRELQGDLSEEGLFMSLSILCLFTAASPVPGQYLPVCTGWVPLPWLGSMYLLYVGQHREGKLFEYFLRFPQETKLLRSIWKGVEPKKTDFRVLWNLVGTPSDMDVESSFFSFVHFVPLYSSPENMNSLAPPTWGLPPTNEVISAHEKCLRSSNSPFVVKGLYFF